MARPHQPSSVHDELQDLGKYLVLICRARLHRHDDPRGNPERCRAWADPLLGAASFQSLSIAWTMTPDNEFSHVIFAIFPIVVGLVLPNGLIGLVRGKGNMTKADPIQGQQPAEAWTATTRRTRTPRLSTLVVSASRSAASVRSIRSICRCVKASSALSSGRAVLPTLLFSTQSLV
jgi:hypothetical protein